MLQPLVFLLFLTQFLFLSCGKSGVLTLYCPDCSTGEALGSNPSLVQNNTLTVTDNWPYTIDNTFLQVTDQEEAASEITFTIISAPTSGTLRNTNTALDLDASDTFTMDDIDNSFIVYTYDSTELADDASEDGAIDNFTFTYSDGPGFTSATTTFNFTANTFCSDKTTATDHLAYPVGSPTVYYFLCTANQLESLGTTASEATDWAFNYKLRSDLDLSGLAGNREAIGNIINNYTGIFDGNNNTVDSWTSSMPAQDNFGFFGLATGTIQNLNLTNCTITGNDSVGCLMGTSVIATITNVIVTGTVTGNSNVGGAIGAANAGSITYLGADVDVNCDEANCGGLIGNNLTSLSYTYAKGTVTTDDEAAGGLVGTNIQDITYSYALGDVDASTSGGFASGGEVGGLIGNHNGGTISYSFAAGSVNGGTNANSGGIGGLVGDCASTTNPAITQSFAIGNVYGHSLVGGFIGEGGSCGGITFSYATGNVTGIGNNIGGFAGENPSGSRDITDSYATGNVSGDNNVGGFLGYQLQFGRIDRTYATGKVTGNGDNIGGLIGYAEGRVRFSYATGEVDGDDTVGGLIGHADNTLGSCSLEDSYSANQAAVGNGVDGNSNLGGLVGDDTGGCVESGNNYWDEAETGLVVSALGTGLANKVALRTATGFNWDFYPEVPNGVNDYWVFPENGTSSDYPKLTSIYKCWGTAWTNSPALNGTGTWDDPYIICTEAQLNSAGVIFNLVNWDKHFFVGDSLNLMSVDYSSTNRMGRNISTYPFSGGFDGNARNGVVIDNFTFSGGSFSGFFGGVVGATPYLMSAGSAFVYDINLTSIDIDSTGNSGGLIGFAEDSTILKIQVDGDLDSASGNKIGGFAGSIERSFVKYIFADVAVTSMGNFTSGAVGILEEASILDQVETRGDISSGGDNTGGVVGQNSNSTVQNSFNTGDVTSTGANSGGVVGYGNSGSMIRNYYTGTTISQVGGLSGNIAGDFNGGNTFTNNFWDDDTSNDASAYQSNGGDAVGEAEGRTTIQMQTEAIFTGWDFDTIWTTNGDTTYPELIWRN